MSFKQFLKPDWRKILLTFVFILIAITIASHLAPFGGSGKILAYIFLFPIDVLLRTPLEPVAPVIEILWCYLLSCLIVWIYDKVKKKS